MFAFETGTLAYQEVTRSRSWRFGRTPRFGAREASQYLGPGDDKVTLTGAILPAISGRFGSLEDLAAMGEEGLAWPLIDGLGNVLGDFVLEQLDHKAGTFLVDGVPRKGDFTISLVRVADDAARAEVGRAG